jgi:regulator of replication initiation timing
MIPNKPYASRYMRKENFESLNYPVTPPHNLSPMLSSTQDYSAAKRSIQQKQIEDLEQKVDIILEHNDRLVNENADLKRRLVEAEASGASNMQKDRMSRYQVEDSEYAIRKIRSELQIKTRECEVMFSEIETAREANSKEIEGLRLIITNLTLSNDEVKL